MAVVHYGDGTLYGDADAYYGRISADLQAAQDTQSRETGLIVKLIDERVNRWEDVLPDADQNPTKYSKTPGLTGVTVSMTQLYWSYRGQAALCVLDNGNLVRVRIDIDDLNVYYQEITDASVAAQWEAWTLLYTGPNYAITVAPNGNNFVVYHAKSNGVYRNNVLEWAAENIYNIRVHRGTDGRQELDKLWIGQVQGGMLSTARQRVRKFDWYYTSDIETVTPVEVPWNYAWYRHGNASIAVNATDAIRISTYPMYAPFAINSGESLLTERVKISTLGTELKGPRLIRGLPGEWGHNYVSGADIFKLSDGYYYLFYTEIHVDDNWEFSSYPEINFVWQRSKDGEVWSEPVHTAHVGWGFAGVAEQNGYLYLCGNGSVYRRPITAVEYDISDFVPEVSWDSPRDNQSGSGQMRVANPDDVNAEILPLSDRRIVIQPGIKTDAGYEFVSMDDFWIRSIRREMDGEINRLRIDFGNVWSRLENPLRDVYNFVGRTDYQDWQTGGVNEPFNYYFDGTSEPSVSSTNQLVTSGKVLWTAWKGLNPNFHVSFASSPNNFTLYFRHYDDNNHLKLVYDGEAVKLYEVSNMLIEDGDEVLIDSASCSGATRLGVRCRWKYFDIYKNGTLLTTFYDDSPILNRIGYVGWEGDGAYSVSNFDFTDLEFNYTSKDLIRQALAIGDYHDTIVGSATAKQYALLWGPQTDLPTAADALRNLLEAEKLELIWRDGIIEVGQFKETGAYKTIENRIIQTEEIQSGMRRINLANVDGNEHTWFETDIEDAIARDRMINAYYDLPELLTKDEVRKRAQEEIRRSAMSEAPGGNVPMFFDLWRMDPVLWVDNAGNEKLVRIEGIQVTINQSDKPSQRETLDTSLIENG